MDEWKKIANHMGRMVIAAVKPKQGPIMGPKSFTDEYPWLKEPSPGEHISKEVRDHWAKMAKIGKW